MSYEKHIEKKGDYLEIRYTGSLAAKDLPPGQNVFEYIADLCRQNKCTKALLDSRELTVDLGVMNLFQLGTQISVVPNRSISFALLGTEEQVPSDNFLENVALNRGGRLKVFTVEEEAVAWLSEA